MLEYYLQRAANTQVRLGLRKDAWPGLAKAALPLVHLSHLNTVPSMHYVRNYPLLTCADLGSHHTFLHTDQFLAKRGGAAAGAACLLYLFRINLPTCTPINPNEPPYRARQSGCWRGRVTWRSRSACRCRRAASRCAAHAVAQALPSCNRAAHVT